VLAQTSLGLRKHLRPSGGIPGYDSGQLLLGVVRKYPLSFVNEFLSLNKNLARVVHHRHAFPGRELLRVQVPELLRIVFALFGTQLEHSQQLSVLW
jgi:hypothetical protein